MSDPHSIPPKGSRAERLYEAHVAFELKRLAGDSGRGWLEDRARDLYEWLGGRSLADVLPLQAAQANLERAWSIAPSAEAVASSERLSLAIHRALGANQGRTEDFIDRAAYDELVRVLSNHAELRQELVRAMVHNDIFGTFVSDIVYHGIQDFAQASRQNIPGAQALFKMGQNLLNQTMPGISEGFEKNAKEFIRNNAEKLARSSEDLLNKGLRPELIAEAADRFWKENAGRQISEAVGLVPDEKLPEYGRAGQMLAEGLRGSPAMRALAAEILALLYDEFGPKPLRAFVDMLGLSEAEYLELVSEHGPRILQLALDTGYLEAQLRAQFGPFYADPGTLALLDA